MPLDARFAGLAGVLPAGVMLAMIGYEYTGHPAWTAIAGVLSVAAIAVFSLDAPPSRSAFVVVGLGLAGWAVATRPDWRAGLGTAIERGAFIIALFTALTAIRTAAMSSREIVACGRFLARQPPGRRYLALTLGGHLFGLVLMYGSIALLGGLAAESTAAEPDAEIRRHRLRRMLLAVHRGFAATLCWSPIAFSMAITTTLVPGASWSRAVLPCLVSAALLLLGGWALDTVFKPRLSRPAPPPAAVEPGGWVENLRPLILLLVTVVAGAALLRALTGVEIVGAVMSLVPAVAVGWIFLQGSPFGRSRGAHTASRVADFVTGELAAFRGQILLLFMAAFIGSLGAFVLVPLMADHGPDLTAPPPALIALALLWIIPLTGQLGMNPILAVSLLIPLVPAPAALGLDPTVLVAAITGGWALSGTTSPFTASVLLVASIGRVRPIRAGLAWNGAYMLVMGAALSLWVLILAALL
ncbi:hypothetical protein [Amaricoccus solimangrovi]|uniref:Uncharacterized protein n=1 Tax=Amaricoccus solimangrovi TaxID=2589815 RepID=A0A501WUX8_9RHOB|nr:hypothetical protein [Amaricoccus solimangrovi]TPE52115.1 hypothetical protein FJM51_06730 [Amaricoccus solimangrovi]